MVFVLFSRQCSHKIAAISLSKSPAKSHAAIMTIPVLSPRPCRTADNILFSPLRSTSQNRGCQSVEKAAAMRIAGKKPRKVEEQGAASASLKICNFWNLNIVFQKTDWYINFSFQCMRFC